MPSPPIDPNRAAVGPGGPADFAGVNPARLRQLTAGIAGTAVAVGAAVALGWIFDLPVLRNLAPGLVSMKFNTALGLMACGGALLFLRSPGGPHHRTGRALAAFAAGLGLVSLAATALGVDPGIDELVVAGGGTTSPAWEHPGRMTLSTSLNFVLLGGSLLLLDAGAARWRQVAQLAALAVTLLSLLALVGYAYGVEPLYQFRPYAAVAVHTAAVLFLLSLGALLARPDRGVAALATGPGAGGGMIRRLLPAAAAGLLAVGWLIHRGELAGAIPEDFGLVLFATAGTLVLGAVTAHTAAWLARSEARRRAAEGDLRASEERFRMIVEGATDYAIYTVSPAGDVLTWCASAARIYGYAAAEVVGQPADRFFTPEDAAGGAARRELDLAAAEGRAVVEGWRVRRDGTRFWATGTLSPLRDAAGAARGFVQVLRDLTERKQAETELRRSETRFRSLVKATSHIVWTSNPTGDVIETTPSWAGYTGLPEEEVRGWGWAKAVHPDDRDRVLARWRHSLASGERFEAEYRVRRADGSWGHLVVRGVPIPDDGGAAGEWVGVCLDDTERHRLEQAFHQAQKMEAVGRLAGGVAHDFNNLLTVINGYGDMVLAAGAPDAPHLGAVREMREAGERAAGLTRQLLAFSRQQVVAPVVLDLNEAVARAEGMLRRLIGEDVLLTTVLDPALPGVRTDPGQIDQVVMNLCVNARDAMPTGGRLTVETRDLVLGEGQAEYPDRGPGRYARLSVTDTGHGMTPEVKARAFEPFFTTKGPGKGTGLGLATVFGIVEQSRGYVSVYSEVGVGTTFHIDFPATEAVPPGPSPGAAPPGPRGGAETVLLVEDEEGVRKIARLALEAQGYHVLTAADGAAAIEAADGHPGTIHLVVTDVVMPRLGGRQVADALRARRPGIRVLFVSGYTDDAVVRHGILEGTDAFLQKPFSPLGLARKVRAVLDGPG
jgi:PAS domain S-box-containing protein